MSANAVSALVLLAEYRESRQRFFPSEYSLQWYVRQHKQGLVQAGALLLHAGRWFADAERFDAFVIEAGSKAAQAQVVAA